MKAAFVALALTVLAAPAVAQTSVTRSETVAMGKQARLGIAPALKRDCAVGPMPEIKVLTAPKNGSLITRGGKIKTPSAYRCPNVETQAQAIFYQSNARYTGEDEVSFEIKTADGALQRFTVKITVTGAATPEPKKGTTDL